MLGVGVGGTVVVVSTVVVVVGGVPAVVVVDGTVVVVGGSVVVLEGGGVGAVVVVDAGGLVVVVGGTGREAVGGLVPGTGNGTTGTEGVTGPMPAAICGGTCGDKVVRGAGFDVGIVVVVVTLTIGALSAAMAGRPWVVVGMGGRAVVVVGDAPSSGEMRDGRDGVESVGCASTQPVRPRKPAAATPSIRLHVAQGLSPRGESSGAYGPRPGGSTKSPLILSDPQR